MRRFCLIFFSALLVLALCVPVFASEVYTSEATNDPEYRLMSSGVPLGTYSAEIELEIDSRFYYITIPDLQISNVYDFPGYAGSGIGYAYVDDVLVKFEVTFYDEQDGFLVHVMMDDMSPYELGHVWNDITLESTDSPLPESDLLVIGFWDALGTWIISAFSSVISLFWVADSGFTILGEILVALFAVPLTLTFVWLIGRWLAFKSR